VFILPDWIGRLVRLRVRVYFIFLRTIEITFFISWTEKVLGFFFHVGLVIFFFNITRYKMGTICLPGLGFKKWYRVAFI